MARVEIPFDSLTEQYDVVRGRGWLEDGLEFAVRVERTGCDDESTASTFKSIPSICLCW